MKSKNDLSGLILDIAKSDDRVRAVLLNGSRANPKAKKDKFRDFDIVFIVKQIDSFLSDHSWIDIFGDRLILQMPEEMTFGDKDDNAFHYLMLFKDCNRIDLTIFPVEKLKTEFTQDSLTVLLLDKDHLFENLPPPCDKDYLIKRPAEKEFADCCNEFWWVSTYIAKGLIRNQIIYAKEILETNVRAMFLKIIEWYIGTETNFSVSFGMHGKFMKEHIHSTLYNKILSTYPDHKAENIWNSLFIMTELFSELANKIAMSLHFKYNMEEDVNVKKYLSEIYEQSK